MASKTELIQEVLNRLYPSPPIPLDHSSGFTFLVAVVLSAQTTDGKVNEVTKELFAVAPTPAAMALMDPLEVQRIIQPVGLAPKKAVYVTSLAKQLVERFGGEVPGSYEELESLPGVGHKTASVIMSQLFNIPSIAVDTHVHRLALRWGLSSSKDVNRVQQDLMAVFPSSSWNKMIYFGREYCSAKNHQPADCPICSWINKPLKRAVEEVSANSSFSPQKRTKSLVYYQDRVEQLVLSPGLVSSPLKKEATEEKEEVVVVEKLDIDGSGS